MSSTDAGASFVVALLGAESTGKTTLAAELAERLTAEGLAVTVVAEYLREFCALQQRTPRVDEQRAIATEQTRRIDQAALACPIVIADTSALMIAVYSDQVFGDTSLHAEAIVAHRRVDLTLLTALDLPWQADGLQRDGPQVRAPVDAKVRAVLAAGGIAFSVVHGQGAARVDAALAAVRRALTKRARAALADDASAPRWQHFCERCGDVDCERRLLRGVADRTASDARD